MFFPYVEINFPTAWLKSIYYTRVRICKFFDMGILKIILQLKNLVFFFNKIIQNYVRCNLSKQSFREKLVEVQKLHN